MILDFSAKIDWFRGQAGDDCVLLPHRIEFSSVPDVVDRFFIDGPIADDELRRVIPQPLAGDWFSPIPVGRSILSLPVTPIQAALCSVLHNCSTGFSRPGGRTVIVR